LTPKIISAKNIYAVKETLMPRIPIRPVRVEGDVAYVPLTQGYEAVIDAVDAAWVGRHNWCARVKGNNVYPVRNIEKNGRQAGIKALHLFMLPPREGFVIDHKDGNGLNNCRSNLRYATHGQNTANGLHRNRRTPGLKGTQQTKYGRWVAFIQHNKKNHYLGTFDTTEEAHAAYREAALRLHGDFARFE
jgi:hypothetical protein